jgi:single-strand DNA-binding protein
MSVNKVILKGRIGKDLESITGGVKFSVATDEGYTKDGNKVEKTAWHNVVAFGKLGEILQKYFSKGSEILIVGKLDYTEKDGKYYTSIIASEFDFVGSSKQANTPNEVNNSDEPPF